MAQMFIISDMESETTEDLEDSGQTEHNSGSSEREQHLTVSDRLKGESVSRDCGIVIRTRVISAVSWKRVTAHLQDKWISNMNLCESQNYFFLWIISVLALVLALKMIYFTWRNALNEFQCEVWSDQTRVIQYQTSL